MSQCVCMVRVMHIFIENMTLCMVTGGEKETHIRILLKEICQ